MSFPVVLLRLLLVLFYDYLVWIWCLLILEFVVLVGWFGCAGCLV